MPTPPQTMTRLIAVARSVIDFTHTTFEVVRHAVLGCCAHRRVRIGGVVILVEAVGHGFDFTNGITRSVDRGHFDRCVSAALSRLAVLG